MENHKSHNLFYLLVTLFLGGVFLPVWGQVDFLDEKNKITEIKRNPAYVYGEGIAGTMEEALKVAEGSLKSEILRIISENESLQNTNVFEVGTVQQNSERVTLKRGTLERVFLYVAKDCIQPGKNGITINFRKEEMAQINQPEQQTTTVKEEVKETEPAEIKIAEPELEIESETESGPGQIEVIEENIQIEESIELDEPVDTEEVNNASVEVSSPLLQKIIATRTMADMEKIFRIGKDERQLMWGNVTSTINPSWNLLIYDREGVKAVLKKGDDKRLNYLTGETETLSDYEGDPKIWFILYE